MKNDSKALERMSHLSPDIDLGLFSRPCVGEVENGDQAAVIKRNGCFLAVVFDGLGHGPKACQAAQLAVHICKEHKQTIPTEILATVNQGLKGTVGAVGAILRLEQVNPITGVPRGSAWAVSYCAVGNISARLIGDGVTRLIGIDGVLGAFRRQLREQTALLGPGGLILLNSDGVQSDSLPADLGASARVLAKAIVSGYGRPHDDATALVIKVAG